MRHDCAFIRNVNLSAPFNRFSAGRDDVLWYYCRLSEIFREQDAAPAMALSKEFQAVENKVNALLN
jgi:hypothetical protein